MIYLTSDLHIFHVNVISYCNRPYKNVDEMYESIIAQFNLQTTENDTIYMLGDISLNPKYIEPFLQRLNCKDVHLITGNHDKCFIRPESSKPQKALKMQQKYLDWGFKSIQASMYITLTKGDIEKVVQLCHFPFAPKSEDNSNGDIRYLNHRPKDQGQLLLHGHSHAYHRKNGRMIDVGYDGDLRLFSEHDIIDLINDSREYIPSPITQYYIDNKERLILKGSKHNEST